MPPKDTDKGNVPAESKATGVIAPADLLSVVLEQAGGKSAVVPMSAKGIRYSAVDTRADTVRIEPKNIEALGKLFGTPPEGTAPLVQMSGYTTSIVQGPAGLKIMTPYETSSVTLPIKAEKIVLSPGILYASLENVNVEISALTGTPDKNLHNGDWIHVAGKKTHLSLSAKDLARGHLAPKVHLQRGGEMNLTLRDTAALEGKGEELGQLLRTAFLGRFWNPELESIKPEWIDRGNGRFDMTRANVDGQALPPSKLTLQLENSTPAAIAEVRSALSRSTFFVEKKPSPEIGQQEPTHGLPPTPSNQKKSPTRNN